MADPRVFFFALSARARAEEVPLGYLRRRGWDIPGPGQATEAIAPGVRGALMSTGDFLLPDGSTEAGALEAVWQDEAPAEWGVRYADWGGRVVPHDGEADARRAAADLGRRKPESAPVVVRRVAARPAGEWTEVADD